MIELALQYVLPVLLLVVGCVLSAGWVRKHLPRAKPAIEAPPDDDVRIVSDLATRLRKAGKTPAVQIALQLHAELLKPEESKA